MPDAVEQLLSDARRAQDHVNRLKKVFVVGCAKSGTTWLMNLLDAHPAVVCRGEGCFAYQLTPLLQQAFGLFNKHQQQSGQGDFAQLSDEQLLIALRTLIDLQFARYLQTSGADLAQITVVGDKTPQHTIGLPALNQLYPDARFIHIIRDPRDATTSASFHLAKSDSRDANDYIRHFMTEVWPTNVDNARRAAPALGPRYLEVKYEELHTNEAEWVARILNFVGVDAGESSVAHCMDAASFQKQSGGRQRGETDNQHFYRNGQVGDWVNHLPADIVAECCAKIGPLMQACGYDPADTPASVGS